MDNSNLDGLQVLKGMLDAIYTEAEKNPAFCEALMRSLPKSAVVEVKRVSTRKPKPAFDPNSINPQAIYFESGDIKLRVVLAELTKANILAVIKRYDIVLPKTARSSKATKQMLIDGIVEAAEFVDREQAA